MTAFVKRAVSSENDCSIGGTGWPRIVLNTAMFRGMACIPSGPLAQTLILPYRFKAGDGRCSVGEFLGYTTERIEAWPGLDSEKVSKIKNDRSPQKRFLELVRCVRVGWDVLVLADGLDELPSASDSWLHDVVIASANSVSRIRWALASRPERGILEILRQAQTGLMEYEK